MPLSHLWSNVYKIQQNKPYFWCFETLPRRYNKGGFEAVNQYRGCICNKEPFVFGEAA